ncbi:hypothetical protein SKAU_G00271560 [Synaphobranchus kaupii]|uniref:Uncharacterized protein n=1 Tax=Synaphobranchus kaupii TaxID=118154 RepID=A0A9Q1F0D5_SYNKA|nr:hypothetical protein SKAU_G00271560 [Synaphobranchus kaupii]
MAARSFTVPSFSFNLRSLCFCKVWKRSGAWFYKAIPKYVRPRKEGERGLDAGLRVTDRGGLRAGVSVAAGRTYSWARSKVVSSDSDSESELSESSLESKAFAPSAVDVPDSKQRDYSVSRGGLLQTPTGTCSGALGSFPSESHSSLGSERGGFLTAAEDYDTDHSRPSLSECGRVALSSPCRGAALNLPPVVLLSKGEESRHCGPVNTEKQQGACRAMIAAAQGPGQQTRSPPPDCGPGATRGKISMS